MPKKHCVDSYELRCMATNNSLATKNWYIETYCTFWDCCPFSWCFYFSFFPLPCPKGAYGIVKENYSGNTFCINWAVLSKNINLLFYPHLLTWNLLVKLSFHILIFSKLVRRLTLQKSSDNADISLSKANSDSSWSWGGSYNNYCTCYKHRILIDLLKILGLKISLKAILLLPWIMAQMIPMCFTTCIWMQMLLQKICLKCQHNV